jgi:hypothetical protein
MSPYRPSKSRLLTDGPAAAVRPIFENEAFRPGRLDAHAEALDVRVPSDKRLFARPQRIDCPLRDFDLSRHRVATKKALAGNARKCGISALCDISMTWERLSTQKK